ncbi:hypothetical protein [Modestobacter roseus]|uniref:Uncharacterized protein n=1 Tax=Modestobacter roseus TaxID=1181884 RepID=A0A562IVE1_9ACTN|nr:hypothetical protein [Modestobacter roseus]MQA33624.1 hypothetical protein [Modestobacter roseus]TWH74743.1 hypothetical protein JD78_03288 [Modestobacter roseus]
MSEAELRDQVEWPVTDPPLRARAGRALGGLFHLASTVATFGADAAIGAQRPSWAAPHDPDAYLGLGAVRLRWPQDAPAEQVQASRRGVWATGAGRPPRPVPVGELRVVTAVPDGSEPARWAEAGWTLTLTDGATNGQLSGAWLALAWIGHLAGWPDPSST